MTEIGTQHSDISDVAKRAFNPFVGFVYATSISLVIRTAYDKTHLDSLVAVSFTLFLVLFFAFDWNARVFNQLKMPTEKTKIERLFLLKFFLDITIVSLLLLASLKVVEIYSLHVSNQQSAFLEQSTSQTLYYATAGFAIFSGFWNTLMIAISEQVDWSHIRHLLRGHLDERILRLFPGIRNWQSESEAYEKALISAAFDEAESFVANKQTEPITREITISKLRTFEEIREKLGFRRIFLRSMLHEPYHLLILLAPYLFAFHVVLFNYLLGFFIALSTYIRNGRALIQGTHHLLFLILIVIGVIVTLSFLVLHFLSRDHAISPYERCACGVLVITVCVGYSFVSSKCLIMLLVAQQLLANSTMTLFFDPRAGRQNANSMLL